MTSTCSSVTFIQHKLCLFMDKALAKNETYASTIQCVIEYKIVSCLMENSSTLIMGSRSRAFQSLEID
jgi:hypothetical protein